MKWRVIRLDTYNAAMNMGIDEAVMESVKEDTAPATIRFYKWLPSAVSIGRFQSMNDEVNVKRCEELDINVVRRITGGGAVYHDNKGEITYSVIAKEKDLPRGIQESYRLICGWVIDGLAGLGIKSEYVPINDIVVGKRKISGNAQTRMDGVLLQHGTILYDLDIKTMFDVLKVSKEKISDKMIKSVEERVTRVLDYKNISQQELYNALLKGFTEKKEYKFGKLSSDELTRARIISRAIYGARGWNFSR